MADQTPETPQAWREAATRKSGSWWDDWAWWAGERAGPLGEPPRVGSEAHPVLGDGPGTYIHT